MQMHHLIYFMKKMLVLLLRGQIAIILMKFHLITKFSQRKAMS